MKVTFQLDLPEEEYEFKNLKRAQDMSVILEELANDIRAKTKHSDDTSTNWDEVREWFWGVMRENEFNPYGD